MNKLSELIGTAVFLTASLLTACTLLTLIITPARAIAAPGQSCADPIITNVVADWEDGGGSPWSAANPARLVDGDLSQYWLYNGNPTRRIKLTLGGNWNISGVQFHDNWGDGQLIVDTDAIDNGNQTTISTDHYPLGWHTESVVANDVNVVYVHADGNVKIDELQLCGTASGGGGGGGTCTSVNPISAEWAVSSFNPPNWQAGDPVILIDGNIDQDWNYYWTQTGSPPVPVVFDFSGSFNLDAIRWRDGHGGGDMIFVANGQTRTVSTDHWPLDWQSADWAVGNVTQVSMTTSSNDVKVAEIEFCGSTTGGTDTIPPEPVTDVFVNAGCTSANLSWPAAVDYDNSGAAGTASSYRIIVNGTQQTTTNTSIAVSNLAENTSYSASIIAIDAAGNESSPLTFTITTNCTPGDDPFPQSANIIDSFGQAQVPDDSGSQWDAVRSYYSDYYSDGTHNYINDGMCTEAVHNSYWVLADDEYYPTWHPPVHNPGGADSCWFMHEHGEDPTTSELYDLDDALSIGIPFGYAHKKMGNTGSHQRHEDHVGHKVIVQNNYTLVSGNPFGAGHIVNEVGINCDWLSKIHQGSYSEDALGNNLHEYFLNVICEGNSSINIEPTKVRVKELVTWGFLDKVFDENCDQDWLWAGYEAKGPRHEPEPDLPADPDNGIYPFSDGKREFGCFDKRVGSTHSDGLFTGQTKLLAELWKPDGVIKAPDDAGSVVFSPYYITRNPSRYIDPFWTTRFDRDQHPNTYLGRGCTTSYENTNPNDNCGSNWHCTNPDQNKLDGCTGTGAMVSSVDLCVRGSDAFELSTVSASLSWLDFSEPGVYPGFCSLLDPSLRQQFEQQIANAGGDSLALSNQRKFHPSNPFNGTLRGVHPKRLQVWQDTSTDTNYEDMKAFCTNAFGDSPDWPTFDTNNEPVCPADEILQGFSPQTNNWGGSNIDGSSINSSTASGGPQNPANEFEQGLRGGGEGGEFVIDGAAVPGNKIRVPN